MQIKIPSTGDLFNGGFSFLLILGGSAGECSAELTSCTAIVGLGDGSLLMMDIESLVFLPGFSSLYTIGGGGAIVVGTAHELSRTRGLGKFEYVAAVELSERGLGGSSS